MAGWRRRGWRCPPYPCSTLRNTYPKVKQQVINNRQIHLRFEKIDKTQKMHYQVQVVYIGLNFI